VSLSYKIPFIYTRVSAYPYRILDYAYTHGHADGEYRILSRPRLHFARYIYIYIYIFACTIKPRVRFHCRFRSMRRGIDLRAPRKTKFRESGIIETRWGKGV